MKIYTEIIYEWIDGGLKEVSSESFDYKGEVIYRKFDKKTETKRVGANYDSLESLCNCICAITIYMAERGFKEEYKVVDTKHTLLNKKNKKRALELLNELA